MGIPFTLPMGFLLTIALAIQLTISILTFPRWALAYSP